MASTYSNNSYVSSEKSSRISTSSRSVVSMGMSSSMYSGAGNSRVRIATTSGWDSGTKNLNMASGMDSTVIVNEKFTMQNLNERLAAYLEKVRLLEKANAELELNIRKFLDGKASPKSRDYSAYYATIIDLQGKTELVTHQSVENDIAGLKRLLDDLHLAKTDHSLQIDTLNEEMAFLKKNHEEDMLAMRERMSGQVHVEVDAVPQADLNKCLEEIRKHYETVTAKTKRKLECWFKTKTESLKQEVVTSTESLQTSHTTVRSKLLSLQAELQTAQSLKVSLEETLAENQASYAKRMAGFQMKVSSQQDEMMHLRADLQHKKQEYNILLDIKTRLELEIAEYRRLLDSETSNIKTTSSSSSTSRTKVITMVEEVMDGKVICSSTSSTYSTK